VHWGFQGGILKRKFMSLEEEYYNDPFECRLRMEEAKSYALRMENLKEIERERRENEEMDKIDAFIKIKKI
jgi:hypothetical protein